MNLKTTACVLFLGLGFATLMTQSSCSKSHASTPATMTLYDSLGGTTMVSDPANVPDDVVIV